MSEAAQSAVDWHRDRRSKVRSRRTAASEDHEGLTSSNAPGPSRFNRSCCRFTAKDCGQRCTDTWRSKVTWKRFKGSPSTSTRKRRAWAVKSTIRRWKAQWDGRKLYDENGEPAALVYKGPAPSDNPYAVDGLSGATITSRGVTNLIRYWASDDGYGPFLEQTRQPNSDVRFANKPKRQEQIDGRQTRIARSLLIR